MPPGALYGRVPVDVGHLSQAEAVRVRRRVGEAVHDHRRHAGLEYFSHPVVELVVGDVAPVVRFTVVHRRHVARSCGFQADF